MPNLDNVQHEKFCLEYVRTGNGRQSYIAAGYSEGAADACASRLLRTAKVAARIDELRRQIAEGTVRARIADRTARLLELQDLYDRARSVIEARGADEEMQTAPGGSTGLLLRNFKQIGSGESARVVEEFNVDIALLREMRALMTQAAQEAGIRFPLAATATAADIVVALGKIMAAVSRGELTPAEGNAVTALLETQRRVLETSDLEERLQRLEAAEAGRETAA